MDFEERSRHLDVSYHPLHQFGLRYRFRTPISEPPVHLCDPHDNNRGRKNAFNRPRKDGRLSDTAEPFRHGRLPRPELKSRRPRPGSSAVRHHQEHNEPSSHHCHRCDGPLQLANHLSQLHLTDRQVPVLEQSSSHSRLSSAYNLGTSSNQNGSPHRLLSIFSEQAIENNCLRGAVMQARDRLHERFRAASLVSDRHNSTSTVAGVENYLAPDEHITVTGAANWETDRNWLASRNSQSDEVLQMGIPSATGSKAPALSKVAIANLTREIFVPRSMPRDIELGDTKFVADQEDCPVCLEQFLCGEELIDLPCFHKFHLHCLTPWLTICGECPYCRANILWKSPAYGAEFERLGNEPAHSTV